MRRLTSLAALLLVLGSGCQERDAPSPREMKARIAALKQERSTLRARVDELLTQDSRFEQMPDDAVLLGVPAGLVRSLIERVVSGYTDSVVISLADLKIHKEGVVKRVITIGEYDLDITIDRVTGRLRTGTPKVELGGNRVTVTLPVQLDGGEGDATIDFEWDGKNISGAVCGDMRIRRAVAGRVRPARYRLRGALRLSNTAEQILATPEFPVLRVTLRVEPSRESWDALQRILDSQEGVCGFVIDKVDIRGALEDLIDRGFNVKLPTDQLQPIVIPISLAPSLEIGDEVVTLGLEVGQLTITEQMLWLGANVSVAAGGLPGAETEPVATIGQGVLHVGGTP